LGSLSVLVFWAKTSAPPPPTPKAPLRLCVSVSAARDHFSSLNIDFDSKKMEALGSIYIDHTGENISDLQAGQRCFPLCGQGFQSNSLAASSSEMFSPVCSGLSI